MKQFMTVILLFWTSTNVSSQDSNQASDEQFDDRLKSHAGAFRDWVNDRLDLSSVQDAELQKLVDAELHKSARRVKTVDGVHLGRSQAGMAPVRFTIQSNIYNFVGNAWIRTSVSDLLNERQQARLLEATRERQQWIRSANLGHVVGVVDDLVMLRERQRDLMITAIRQVADKDRRKLFELDTGLFRFPDEKSVLPSSQLYVFLSGPPRDLLDSGQKFILDGHSTRSKMVRGRHTTRVPLPINAADELQMKRDIVAFLNMHRVDFARIVNERVAGLAESLALTDSQKRHLVVAGKGATKRCLVRWRSENIEKLQQMAEQVQRLGRADFGTLKISVRGPSVHALEDELVWQYAIAKITSNVSARRNHAERRKATVDYVTAMFDKELWLTPDQRERFSALIDASFPPVINIEQPHAKELELLVTPLFRVSADELKTVLRESQIAAWTSLGNQFERRGDQVILTLGDSSQVSFQLTP